MVRASLRTSRLLTSTLLLVHSAAAATLWPIAIPSGAKALLFAAVVASLGHALRLYALLCSRKAIVELQVVDCERAWLRMRAGEWRGARILGTSCVTPMLTAMNLKVQGFRMARHVLLVRDNVDAADFRQVRVILRWARSDGDDERAPTPPRA